MPIYPSNNYNNQIPSSLLTMNNITSHREVSSQTNADGTCKLTPASLASDFRSAMNALYAELQSLYFDGAIPLDADSALTGNAPSVSNKKVDTLTNLKQIKLRRLQTRCKLINFNLLRLYKEMVQVLSLTDDNIPVAADNIYPSSKRSPDPNGGW